MKIRNFELEKWFAKYEFSAKYLLCSSDCESFNVEELLKLEPNAGEELKNLVLGYTETRGDPNLREEISRLYENTKPEDILVCAGAEEGIFIFMNVLLDEGDHIIVQFPGYQSLYEVANSIGCEVTKWGMNELNNWKPDIDSLEISIKENTKAIVINSPHNPTGHLMSSGDYNKIIDIAQRKGIYVFLDEVYRLLEFDENDRLPAICDRYDKGVSLGVMSKTFGLAGLRIGWIATKDKSLVDKMTSFKHYTSICSSAPSEFFSILALKNKEYLLERNLGIIGDNLQLLDGFFQTYGDLFTWVRPKAGSIAFPRAKFDGSVEDFCVDLVQKKGVLLLPSTKYDFGDRHFRLGFGRKNMPEALGVLGEYIQEHFVEGKS